MVPIIAIMSDSNLPRHSLSREPSTTKDGVLTLTRKRLGPAVADNIKPHLALGGLDALVDFALRRRDAFLDQLEMVDQAGDVAVDHLLGGQAHPGVGELDVPGLGLGDLFQGLLDDAVALEHLLHPHQVPGVGVALLVPSGTSNSNSS